MANTVKLELLLIVSPILGDVELESHENIADGNVY